MRHAIQKRSESSSLLLLPQPSAAPLRSIWQCEQVQAGEEFQGEHEYRRETQPVRVLVLGYSNAVDNDHRRESHRQPAVCQPNPFVPVQ